MKTNIAMISSIYKPQRKRKNSKRTDTKLLKPKVNFVQNPSLRSLSVTKNKEQSFMRVLNNSAEPHLPPIKSRSPEPQPVNNAMNISANSSFSYEADLQKLENLISRNQSARHGLLKVQTRIMEIEMSNALKSNLDSIDEEYFITRKELKLPPIRT